MPVKSPSNSTAPANTEVRSARVVRFLYLWLDIFIDVESCDNEHRKDANPYACLFSAPDAQLTHLPNRL